MISTSTKASRAHRSLLQFYALGLLALLGSCSSEPPSTSSTQTRLVPSHLTPRSAERYVLMSYKAQVIPAGPLQGRIGYSSYISYSDTLPQGTELHNLHLDNTLTGRYASGGGGLLEAYGQIYRFSDNANQQRQSELLTNVPVQLRFAPEGGGIEQRAYLETRTGFSQAAKNFAIGPQRGFLAQPSARNEDFDIQLFDPQTFAPIPERILVNAKDRERMRKFVLERTPSLRGQELPLLTLGDQLMVLHGDALIMDLRLLTAQGGNISRDSYLVAYEAKAGGRLLSLSYLPNTGRLGSASELLQYSHDETGDLYLMSQGGDPQGFYRNALLYRIKRGGTELDDSWSYPITEIGLEGPVRFNGILARGGKVLTLVNIASLSQAQSAVPANLWRYYVLDVATRQAKPLEGLQACSAPLQGVNLGTLIGDKLYLRYVRTGSDAPYNGYYSYDPHSGQLQPAFSLSLHSGYVADFKHITLSTTR